MLWRGMLSTAGAFATSTLRHFSLMECQFALNGNGGFGEAS